MSLINYEQQALALFTKEDIEVLKKFNELEARVKLLKKQRNEELRKLFAESGSDKFEGGGIRIIHKNGYSKKVVDSEKLKKEGLYDLYTKTVNVSDSVVVEVIYD